MQELFDQVAPEEVVHGTSGALPVAAENAASSHRANKQLFGQWISIVYMTFAQVCISSYRFSPGLLQNSFSCLLFLHMVRFN